MVDTTAQRGASPAGPRHRALCDPAEACPMPAKCRGMMEWPHSGLLLILPGVALIVLGALTILEPMILVWLAGAASVLLGLSFLLMAGVLRKRRQARPRRDGGEDPA